MQEIERQKFIEATTLTEDKPWECSVCHYHNKSHMKLCEMCSVPKPEEDFYGNEGFIGDSRDFGGHGFAEDYGFGGNKSHEKLGENEKDGHPWACPACTFQNFAVLSVCEVCGTEKI